MSRHLKTRSNDMSFPTVILIAVVAWVHRALLFYAAYVVFGAICSLLFLKVMQRHIIIHNPRALTI